MEPQSAARRPVGRIILFILPALFACSLLAPAGTPAAGPTATPSPLSQPAAPAPTTASAEGMTTIYTLEDGETQVSVMKPNTLDELLEAQIEAGAWSEGQGLSLLLAHLAGERDLDQVPGLDDVTELSVTWLLRRTQHYLTDPDHDPQHRAELERLLAKFSPTQEQLDRLSRPAPSARRVRDHSIGWPAQGSLPSECAGLEDHWFAANVDTGEYCYHFRDEIVLGHRLRVYYPKWWEDHPDLIVSVNAAQDALARSTRTYAPLGSSFRDVYLAFSHRQLEQNWGAHVPPMLVDDDCPIIVLPRALPAAHDHFRQVIAHELFHCFQSWNLGDTVADDSWWWEGSAEYFSNVVYPDVNKEYAHFADYYALSHRTSIFDMDYENFLLFQHLGNELGNAALLELLKQVGSNSGGSDHSVLSAYPGFDALFHEFVVATVSDGVRDSDGSRRSRSPIQVLQWNEVIEEEGERRYQIQPFVAGRFALRYEQEHRFLQEPVESGNERHSAVRNEERTDPNAWSGLPPELRSTCFEEERYMLIVTSVEQPGDFRVNVTEVEEAECDPCLLGTWDVETISYANYYMNLFEAQGEPLQLFMTGSYFLQFKEKGEFLTRRAGFEVHAVLPDQPTLITTIDGQGHGSYSTSDGQQLSFNNVVSHTNNVTARVEGAELPGMQGVASFGLFDGPPGGSGSGPDSHSAPYTCTNERLTIEFPEYGDVEFLRVDEVIPTPVPTPGG